MAWNAKAHLQNSKTASLPSQKSQSMPPLSRQWLASSPESLAVRNVLQHNRSQGRTSAVLQLDRSCNLALDGMTLQHASPISNTNMTSKLLTGPMHMDSMHCLPNIDAGAKNCHVLPDHSTAHPSLHGGRSSDDNPMVAHEHAAHSQHAIVNICNAHGGSDVLDKPTQVTVDRPAAPSQSDLGIEECPARPHQGLSSDIARSLLVAAKADDSEGSAEVVDQEAAKRLVLHAEALLQAEQDLTYSLIARKQLGDKNSQKVGTCYPLSTHYCWKVAHEKSSRPQQGEYNLRKSQELEYSTRCISSRQ